MDKLAVNEVILDIKLEQNNDQLVIIRQSISKIDQYLHTECQKQGIKYRVHEKLGDISMYPHFDDIHFRRYIGEDLERTEFLDQIWQMISYRADLVYKYRAYLGAYQLTISNIRGEK
tara:strand:+ start:782 stop:1132 length:351 start_codon:yes stop_codon:yes gene_type:complete